MLPLQAIAAGLIVFLFDFNLGYPQVDLVPDPLGWAAVYYGVGRLPRAIPLRSLMLGLATLAGVLSLVLWVPGMAESLAELNESLPWSMELPGLGFVAALAVALRQAATAGGDAPARAWWQAVLVGLGLSLLLPLLVYAGDVVALGVLAALVALATMVTCVVLCFAHARRPWVQGSPAPIR